MINNTTALQSKRHPGLRVLTGLGLTVLVLLTAATPANAVTARDSLELITSSCTSGSSQYLELNELKTKIAQAESVDAARIMALAPTNVALEALENANAILPFSDELQSAQTRLSQTRNRILVASSQAQVADEFSGMLLAGLDDDRAAHVSAGSSSCNYSTGEIIAIVIGLILGIIPGLILLVVLC